MKKMFTLALAAMTTAAAFAEVTPRVEHKSYDASAISYLDLEFAQKKVAPASLVKVSGLMNKNTKRADLSQKVLLNNSASSLKTIREAAAKAAADGATAGENTGTPMYLRPGTELFGTVNLIVKGSKDPSQDGIYTLSLLSPVISLGKNVFLNQSYIIEDNQLKLDESINSWFYANWSDEELISENDVTATDLTIDAFPTMLQDMVLPYPELSSAAGESFQVGYDNNGKFTSLRYVFGGQLSFSDDELKSIANQFASQFPGATLTAELGGYTLSNTIDDKFDSSYYGTAFSAGSASAGFEDEPEMTFTQNSDYYWSAVLNTEAAAVAWCQEFAKPGSPMALKNISMPFIIQCQEGAKLSFNFFEVSEDGEMAEEPFKTYEETFKSTDGKPARFEVEIPFSTPGDIDDLPFQLIDKAMLLVITGFTDTKFELCSPFVNMYTYDQTAPISSEPSSLFSIVSYRDAQGQIDATLASPNILLGGSTMNALRFTVDASYPYVRLGANMTTESEENEGDIIANAHNANVILKKANDGVWTELFFSGNDPLEELAFYNYDNPEDESFLDWLDLAIDPEKQVIENYELAPYMMYFGVAEGKTPGEVNLALTYNGLVYVVHIGAEVAGIDNVTAVEKAELDWNAPVYNVMGQKVSKGFTGIAIQNGNKFIVK